MERLNILYNKKPCYDIVFTRGFEELLEELNSLELTNKKACIITDTNVGPIYATALKEILEKNQEQVHIFTIPAGEENKTLDTVKTIYTYLIEQKFNRKDFLVALGGGVVGDITGYCAATYLRGIDFIQIPTTLLAQSDSSIGGKTGVDFDGYKNMIGAFKMPRLVYMNFETLSTLDERQFANGFAEIMKHGLIKDAEFYMWLIENMYEIAERDMDTISQMVQKSCYIKKMVVEKDPLETGERALLNYGHTLGHAIEKASGFTLLHGECVALGCILAAYISYKMNYLSMDEYYEIRDMFVPFNLPISTERLDIDKVIANTKSDKKSEGNTIKFVLLKKIGKAFIHYEVTDELMREALEEINFSEEDLYE